MSGRLPSMVAAVLVTALSGAPAVADEPAPGFTLEEVLSYPYAYPAAAATEAPRIAWKVYQRGVRNLWTAAAPDFEPVRLTSYSEDDGQNLDDLQLTPDGATLIYVRGNGKNDAGEHANPSSDPDGAEQAIWAVATDGRTPPRKLATGSGPVLSPDGATIVFAARGAVLELPVGGAWPRGAHAEDTEDTEDAGDDEDADADEDGDAGERAKRGNDGENDAKAAAPRELFRARGGFGALLWSPDGERIAFVSYRGDHSFIGVYDRGTDTLRWLAPSVDRDDWPVWSPDGSRVAFVRAPGARAGERFDLTSGNAFAIWIADPATGKAHELWRTPPAAPGEEAGGFAQYYPTVAMRWVDPAAGSDSREGAGGRILFTSEHTGWLHVHSLPAASGEAVDLTPGECESEASAATADGRTLIFSSNCGDIDRRHLWRVPTAGGVPEPVTPPEGRSDGVETDPVIVGGGRKSAPFLAFRRADARRPQAMVVSRLDGTEPRVLGPGLPANFPVDDLVPPEPVVLHPSDGLEVHAQLFLPPGSDPDHGHPAAIFLHGGPIRQMLLGWHYSDYYARAYAMNQYLASRGYVVLALNYRSGIGYGQGFRRAEGQGPRGATEYRDVLAAGLYLRRRGDVDLERIGLWGGSYGGYLTALGLARDSDLFAAGVDLHGVHDWSLRATERSPGGAWGLTDDLLDTARTASPVADLSTWSSPVLLIHGDDDRNVLFLQTTDLVQRLREREIPVEVLVLPDEVHGFLRHESWLSALGAADRFFERYLRGPGTGEPGDPEAPDAEDER